jgi:hypothetical protein
MLIDIGTKMNWYKLYSVEYFLKLAAKIADINELKAWNDSFSLSPNDNKLMPLRNILGNIIKHLNEASYIFKVGVRSPDPTISQKAAEIFPDIANIETLHNTIKTTQSLLNRLENKNTPIFQVIYNMLYAISNMNFSIEQKEQFRQIASGSSQSAPEFADEVNADRMNRFLQSSIYSTRDASARSLRVIREVLQNSADAVMKQRGLDPTNQVRIDIYTVPNQDNTTMDLVVSDSGTGMDWNTLSRKFFVYFESGKQEDVEAAGGFGIAKALIQEVPQEGWSIDTSGIHSSKFHKNMYMGTPKSVQYSAPPSIVQSGKGTTLTLYAIPFVYNSSILDLANKYATNGILKISVNKEPAQPTFLLTQLKPIGGGFSGLSDEISETQSEKDVANGVLLLSEEGLLPEKGRLDFNEEGTKTSVQFFCKKTSYSGRFYVFLNNQYQFDRNYIPKANIICNIMTNTRPGTELYPVDPGRENLREPYKTQIEEIENKLEETLKKISEHMLFKDGLNIVMLNQNAVPMSTGESEQHEGEEGTGLRKAIEEAQQSVFVEGLFGSPQEQISKILNKSLENIELEPEQTQVLQSIIDTIQYEDDERIDVKDKIGEIIDGLITPAAITVQKNFVSADIVRARANLTSNMMILWQRVLKIITAKISHSSFKRYGSKKFIPGIIFSDEALALYMPPKEGLKHHAVMVNPIVMASLIDPDLFNKILGDQAGSGQKAIKESGSSNYASETPTNKLTVFLFHIAIHELVHLMFPDSYGYDEFHSYISKMEAICHFDFTKVRDVVKDFMPRVKRDAQKLIRAIGKDKRKRLKNQ